MATDRITWAPPKREKICKKCGFPIRVRGVPPYAFGSDLYGWEHMAPCPSAHPDAQCESYVHLQDDRLGVIALRCKLSTHTNMSGVLGQHEYELEASEPRAKLVWG